MAICPAEDGECRAFPQRSGMVSSFGSSHLGQLAAWINVCILAVECKADGFRCVKFNPCTCELQLNSWELSIFLVCECLGAKYANCQRSLQSHQPTGICMQLTGNYHVIIALLTLHLGIAACFLLGHQTSLMTVVLSLPLGWKHARNPHAYKPKFHILSALS